METHLCQINYLLSSEEAISLLDGRYANIACYLYFKIHSLILLQYPQISKCLTVETWLAFETQYRLQLYNTGDDCIFKDANSFQVYPILARFFFILLIVTIDCLTLPANTIPTPISTTFPI